jgi:hypothetical protein
MGAAGVAQAIQIGPKIRVNLGHGTVAQVLHNAGAERDRVDEHVGNELTNLGKNTVEAVDVTGKTVDRQFRTVMHATGTLAERLVDGDVLGAGYAFGNDYLHGTRDNTMRALRDSSGLRFAAQVAISAYAGPVGTGLFAAGMTYDATGRFDDALRAGVISGVASAASGAASDLPTDTVGQIAERGALGAHQRHRDGGARRQLPRGI